MPTFDEFKNNVFILLSPISEEFINDPKVVEHMEQFYNEFDLSTTYDYVISDGIEKVVWKVEDAVNCCNLETDWEETEYEQIILAHIVKTTHKSIRTAVSKLNYPFIQGDNVPNYLNKKGDYFVDSATYIAEARFALQWLNKYITV